MQSLHPAVDPVLWLRFLVGVGVVLGVPGWLLTRRHTSHYRGAARAYFALAAGLVATVGIGHTLAVIQWSPALPVAWAMTVAIGIAAHHGLRPTGSAAGPVGPGPWIWLPCALVAAVHLYGLRELVAPPHIHDAANHAFLTWRIAATRSMGVDALFAEVAPGSPYFAGWHFAAAVVGELAGLAPHLVTWLLPLLALTLLPLALATLWESWGARAGGLVLATLFLCTNNFVPTTLLGWGGFGALVGLFLVPAGAILFVAAARGGGRWRYAALGAFLAVLVHIHFSETVTVVLFGALALWWRGGGRRPTTGEALALLAGLGLAFDPQLFGALVDYRALAGEVGVENPRSSVFGALRSYFLALGKPDLRMVAAAVGLLWALGVPAWRKLVLASFGLGAWYIALAAWRDPVSTWLATPFYQVPVRVLHLQVFLLPLLAGLGWVVLLRRDRRLGPVVALLVVWFLGAGVRRQLSGLEGLRAVSPFTEAEYGLALGLREQLGEDAVVANFLHDGSVWAMHVSGLNFVYPMSWPARTAGGLDLREAVAGLREDPWPAPTLALRELGATHLYTSHVVYSSGAAAEEPLDPADFAGDPRFSPAAACEDAVVWEIHWGSRRGD